MIKLYIIGFIFNLIYMYYEINKRSPEEWEKVKEETPKAVLSTTLLVFSVFYPVYYLYKLIQKLFKIGD